MSAATYVNAYTAAFSSGAGGSLTGVVVGAGQSLIVGIAHLRTSSVTITSVKWNTTESLTLVSGCARTFFLKNPTAGTHNIDLVLSGVPTTGYAIIAIVVNNVDQTTPLRTASVGTSISVTPVSAVDDLVVAFMSNNFGDTNDLAEGTGVTEVAYGTAKAGNGSSALDYYAGYRAGLATSTTMAWTVVTNDSNSTRQIEAVALIGAVPSGTTFYLTDAYAIGSNHGALQQDGSAPADAATLTGWTVAGRAVGDFARMAYNLERGAGTFSSTAQPSGAPNNAVETGAGDCFRIGPLTGSFPAGDWNFSFAVRADSLGGTQDGRMNVRVWRSANADGSSATEITAGATALSTVTNLTTSASQNSTGTVTLGAVSLTNEYLFIQLAWEVTGVA
ncbi:MAG TPA: hypothetical protein VIY48_21825 [Candidatus Paceibacterota bacterium]